MVDTLQELRDAARGIPPQARPCADRDDLAWWFAMVELALRNQRRARVTCRIEVVWHGAIERVETTVRVAPEDNVARRGRLLPNVRR